MPVAVFTSFWGKGRGTRQFLLILLLEMAEVENDAKENSVACSYATLKDFDWSMRLVLSSSKLSGLRQPLVLLKLEKTLPDGSLVERLVELDEQELEKLIGSLKAAQKAVLR